MFGKNRARRNRYGQSSANDVRREAGPVGAQLTEKGVTGGPANIFLTALQACGYAIGSALGAVLAEKTNLWLQGCLRNERLEKPAGPAHPHQE